MSTSAFGPLKLCCYYPVRFRFQYFKSSVKRAFEPPGVHNLKLEKLVEQACRELPQGENPFTAGEISAAMKKLTDENLIMLADNMVFVI